MIDYHLISYIWVQICLTRRSGKTKRARVYLHFCPQKAAICNHGGQNLQRQRAQRSSVQEFEKLHHQGYLAKTNVLQTLNLEFRNAQRSRRRFWSEHNRRRGPELPKNLPR